MDGNHFSSLQPHEVIICIVLSMSIVAGLVYCVVFLPDKFPAYRKWEFERNVNFIRDTQQNGGRVPAPFTKGTYEMFYRKAVEYMENEGIREAEVTDIFGNTTIVQLQQLKEQQERPTIRVRKLLEKMNYTDQQIANIFTKAENECGKGIRQNYDELLLFTLNELKNI